MVSKVLLPYFNIQKIQMKRSICFYLRFISVDTQSEGDMNKRVSK